MRWTRPVPLCRWRLNGADGSERFQTPANSALPKLLITCFQESGPIEISSRLHRLEATSDHVSGSGRGHVQVKILRDRVGATCKDIDQSIHPVPEAVKRCVTVVGHL